jgi:hypothetical protein
VTQPRPGKLAVVAVIAAVLGFLVVAYFAGALVASATEKDDAESKLRSVFSHRSEVGDALSEDPARTYNPGSSDFNPANGKSVFDGYLAKVNRARATNRSDESGLRATDDRIQSRRWLTAMRNSELDRQHRRLQDALSGLKDADQELEILKDQVTYFSTLFDALIDFQHSVELLQTEDLSGAIKASESSDKKMQKALTISRSGNVPPPFLTFTNNLRVVVGDMRDLLAAANRNDTAAAQQTASRMDEDLERLSGFNQGAYERFEDALLKPFHDDYVSKLDKAQSG